MVLNRVNTSATFETTTTTMTEPTRTTIALELPKGWDTDMAASERARTSSSTSTISSSSVTTCWSSQGDDPWLSPVPQLKESQVKEAGVSDKKNDHHQETEKSRRTRSKSLLKRLFGRKKKIFIA